MSSSERQRSRQRTRNLFVNTIKATLKKPEKLTVSQWAEKYRILDESSNFSGQWSNDITPYLVGIMDAFNDPYIQEINFCKPTQVGGTEAMLNMLGWIIMDSPSPTMIVYPSDDLAKDTSNDRIKPSLTKTPEIKERFYEHSSKELNLKFRGMKIYLRGSGSPGKLASKSIKYLFFDEIDKMDGASKKEASPYNLAKERTRTFTYSKKIYTCSTPTLKTNYVWQIHEDADEQRHYFMPCPHCGEHITFAFKQIHFPSGEGMTNAERAKEAVYVCQECGCEITDMLKGIDEFQKLRKSFSSIEEFQLELERNPEQYGAVLPEITGYTYSESDKSEYIKAYSLSSNETIRNEVNNMDQNLLSIKGKKFPTALPVLTMISSENVENIPAWKSGHENQLDFSSGNHQLYVVEGGHYIWYTNLTQIVQHINEWATANQF